MDFIPRSHMDDFYAAEEAVLNALVANSDMIGRDGNVRLLCPTRRWLPR
ncbi:hypothetical protein [Mesorhizobium sp. dw_380]